MQLRPNLIVSSVLVTLLGSSASFAAITADDVWKAMTETYGSMGLQTTATQTRDGNILKISDWKIHGTFPKQMGGSVSISTTGLELTENGDGTVSLSYPSTMPIAVAITLPDDKFLTVNFDLQMAGYVETLSGDPDNIQFEYTAASMALILKDIGAPEMPLQNLVGEMRYTNMVNTGTLRRGDMFGIAQKYHSDAVSLVFSADIEDAQGRMEYSATYDNYGGNFDAQLPAGGIDVFNLPALLRAGMNMAADMNIGQMTTHMTMVVEGETIQKQDISVASSVASMSFSKDGLSMLGEYKDYLVDMIDQKIPFPIKVQMPHVGVALDMPVLKSDAEQSFRLMYDFRGITIDENLWAMIDQQAGGALPHDPITLTFDVSGKGQLYYDLLDFETMARISNEEKIPGDITSIAIDNLNIAAVGAALTGTGAFDINTKDLETFDGFPAIDGKADIKITGSNALIDKLIELGMVEENEAMGARMMMGIFMQAGEGEDVLTSAIEVTKDGHVSANGQRLK